MTAAITVYLPWPLSALTIWMTLLAGKYTATPGRRHGRAGRMVGLDCDRAGVGIGPA